MDGMLVTLCLLIVGAISGWHGARALDRAFRLLGEYGAGPAPYPAHPERMPGER